MEPCACSEESVMLFSANAFRYLFTDVCQPPGRKLLAIQAWPTSSASKIIGTKSQLNVLAFLALAYQVISLSWFKLSDVPVEVDDRTKIRAADTDAAAVEIGTAKSKEAELVAREVVAWEVVSEMVVLEVIAELACCCCCCCCC